MSTQQAKRFDSFELFRRELESSLQLALEKRKPAILLSLLKQTTGFVPSDEQVSAILDQLRALPQSDMIYFSVFTSARVAGNPSRFIGAVADRIGRDYASLVKFKPDAQPKTWPDVRDWINALPLGSKKPDERAGSVALVRAAFATLLQFQTREFFNPALLLLVERFVASKRRPRSSPVPLGATVTQLLGKPAPNAARLKLLLQCGNAFQDELSDAFEVRRQGALRAEALERQLSGCQDQLADAAATLNEHANQTTLLKSKLEQTETQLTSERQKVANTEKHWEVQLDQKLAGLSSKISVQLSHEIQEIELCLNRNSPNTEMALQRLRRIGQILSSLTEGK
jgi:hypothetical protein